MKNRINLQNFLNLLLENKNSFSIELIEGVFLDGIREKFNKKIYHNGSYSQKDVYLEIKSEKSSFDFIVGIFPFGINFFDNIDDNLSFREISYIYILELLKNIDKNGVGLFLVLPNIFISQEGKKFIDELNKKGFYINAVFNSSNILEINTGFKPIFILVSQEKKEKVFICEPTENTDFKIVLENYYTKNEVNYNLSFGIFIKKEDFLSFPNYKIKQSIKILNTTYKNYNCYKLGEIGEIIHLKKGEKIHSIKNSLFFPIYNGNEITFNIFEIKNKENYYIHIVLDNTKALSKYIEIFFKSKLGKLIKESFSSFSSIPGLKKTDILNFEIYLPHLEKQKEIISNYDKFEELKNLINLTENELGVSPDLKKITENMIKLENQLKQTTEANKIKNQILDGESQILEFKKCLGNNKKYKTGYNITQAIFKTMVAFFNTNGGTILIGVDNNGEIVGIEEDKNYENNDKYLNRFDSFLNLYIGADCAKFYNSKIKLIDEKRVLVIKSEKSNKDIYLNNNGKKEFYRRLSQGTFIINENGSYIERNVLIQTEN